MLNIYRKAGDIGLRPTEGWEKTLVYTHVGGIRTGQQRDKRVKLRKIVEAVNKR